MKHIRWIILCACVVLAMAAAACGAAVTPDPNAAKPSNPGGTGKALSLTGDPVKGKQIFADKCVECHGEEGKGGIANEGAEEDVPELNPIDSTMVNTDLKVFAANIDVFIEHGSTPGGDSPTRVMLPFGDSNLLQPQDIADVIAYVISLNSAK
jgi:cytochrome c